MPKVGLYNPNYTSIKGASFRAYISDDINFKLSKERIALRDFQQSKVCMRQIKSLNFSLNHQNSEAVQLESKNKKFLIDHINATETDQNVRA